MRNTITLATLLLLSVSVHADSFDTDFSGGLDTTVDQVLSRGLWQEGKRYGRWRLVSRNLGWEHTRSYLYLQWLRSDDDKQQQVELMTVPIPEFNDTDWRHLVRMEYKSGEFGIYYTLRIEPEIVKRASLKPATPGVYQFHFDHGRKSK